MTAVLGRQRSQSKTSGTFEEGVTAADDETIEKCLNEVEAALHAGLNFKGKFNSGLKVRITSGCKLCL